jgi:hypothetical protein
MYDIETDPHPKVDLPLLPLPSPTFLHTLLCKHLPDHPLFTDLHLPTLSVQHVLPDHPLSPRPPPPIPTCAGVRSVATVTVTTSGLKPALSQSIQSYEAELSTNKIA